MFTSEGSKFDVERLERGSLDDALALVNCRDSRVTFKTLAFVTMVALVPHCAEIKALGQDISFSNILHGILYHYLIVN